MGTGPRTDGSGWTSCFDGKYVGVSLLPGEMKCPDISLRYNERHQVHPLLMNSEEFRDFHFIMYFDKRRLSRFEASLNITMTLFICVILGFGSLLFSKDANTLVLTPIERISAKMEKIRKNPLEAMRLGEEGDNTEASQPWKDKEKADR